MSSSDKKADVKPDFSGVKTGFKTTEEVRPDFSAVQTGFRTTEEVVGEPDAAPRTYTIEKGDTLSHVAKRFYGKAKYWRQIHEANREAIPDPDRIFPGQSIVLPAIDTDCDGDLDEPADD